MGEYQFSEYELAVRRWSRTEDGKTMLKHFKKYKTDKAFGIPNGVDGMQTALMSFFVNGQATMVEELNRIIERDDK